MVNMIIGMVLIMAGLWGFVSNWLIFFDVLKILIFLLLVVFGIVALLSGLRRLKTVK